MPKKPILFLISAILIVGVFLIGCGDDDDPTTVPNISPTGSISVDPNPDILNATWQLTGPDGYLTAGVGDLTMDNLFPGNYALSWGDMATFDTPNPNIRTQYLESGKVLSFAGQYVYSGPSQWAPVVIPPASVSMPVTFTMGSTVESNETPHQVTLTHRINLSATEVSNAQYIRALQWAYDHGFVTVIGRHVLDALDGSTVMLLLLTPDDDYVLFRDGVFSTANPDYPVTYVTWEGAIAYCDWLSLQIGLPRAYDHNTWTCNDGNPYEATGYRLPTEAEWEFSCRAGTTGPFYTGDCLSANTQANYAGPLPYPGCPSATNFGFLVNIGSLSGNSWGVHEIHGNVFEFCNDSYALYSGDETDPVGGEINRSRVTRGGGYESSASRCRSAFRNEGFMSTIAPNLGFRIVRTME